MFRSASKLICAGLLAALAFCAGIGRLLGDRDAVADDAVTTRPVGRRVRRIQHDAEFYVLAGQSAQRRAAEDDKLDSKLAALRARAGKRPNIVCILWDDMSFGEVGFAALPKIGGFACPRINRSSEAAALEIPRRLAGLEKADGAEDQPRLGPREDLGEVSRELDNPLGRIWALVLQNNLNVSTGDRVCGRHVENQLFFQPLLPVPVGERKQWLFTTRPVFPLVTEAVLDPAADDGIDRHETCAGDIQVLTLFGPNRRFGWTWGLGSTWKLPTAPLDVLGDGKWQVGPAATLVYDRKPWLGAILLQHWWSFAGDNHRRSTSQTDLKYIVTYQLSDTWSIGTSPTVSFDWRRPDSSDKATLPVGVGVAKTFRVGRLPVRVAVEAQYSVVKPDSFGTEWNFRLQIVPIIPSPFR